MQQKEWWEQIADVYLRQFKGGEWVLIKVNELREIMQSYAEEIQSLLLQKKKKKKKREKK